MAIVGTGPIGLAAIVTGQLFTPGKIVAIDLADARLDEAPSSVENIVVNNSREDALARVQELTDGLGADVAIEAVGVPETFELCTELIRPAAGSQMSVCTDARERFTQSVSGSATY